MTRLDDDVRSDIKLFAQQEELLQNQREARLYERVRHYVYNTTQRQPGGFNRDTASDWLRNKEYHQTFYDYGDPQLKEYRVKAHVGELLKLANGDKQLLEFCFNRALESLFPIPAKRYCWKVRVAKSKHLDAMTVFLHRGLRPPAFELVSVKVTKLLQANPS